MSSKKTVRMLGVIPAVFATLVVSEAQADEVDHSPVTYLAASLLIVDVGAAIGNGIALLEDRPNRLNGYFGVLTGVVSLGFVAANYATTENDDLRDDFALVMGTAGLASLTLGVLNIRRSRDASDEIPLSSDVTISPNLVALRDQKCGVGIGIRMTF